MEGQFELQNSGRSEVGFECPTLYIDKHDPTLAGVAIHTDLLSAT